MGTPIREYVAVKCDWASGNTPDVKDNEFQIFYEGSDIRMVDFLCPCGCGHRCPTHVIPIEKKKTTPPEQLSVFDRHCWGFDPITLTLYPSIRWTSGCKAHFNIENGKVIMHGDSGK